jgi:hypothetical protein
MELIVSLFAAIGAFLGTVAAHFVAHDAYSNCPRYARRLIERAACRLPPFERTRYEEEWLADLEERDGVFAKFKHAFDCLLCARTLSSLSRGRAPAYIEFSVPGVGKARLDFVAGIVALKQVEDVYVGCDPSSPAPRGAHFHRLIEDLQKKLVERYGELPPYRVGQLDKLSELLEKRHHQPMPSRRPFDITLILHNGRAGNLVETVRALGIRLPSGLISR